MLLTFPLTIPYAVDPLIGYRKDSRVRVVAFGSRAPRAGAAPTAGRVRFRATSSGAISNRGGTLGASGERNVRFDHGCALPPRTREIAPCGPTPGALSRFTEASAKPDGACCGTSNRVLTRSKTLRPPSGPAKREGRSSGRIVRSLAAQAQRLSLPRPTLNDPGFEGCLFDSRFASRI
jgi:hypothetical protein